MQDYSRRLVLGGMAALTATPAFSKDDATFVHDFDELWQTLADRYAFFEEKATDWDRVRVAYRPLARTVNSRDDFALIVRRVLAELYDSHTSMSGDWPGLVERLQPFDVLVKAEHGRARVIAVRQGNAAGVAGVAVDDLILSVDGNPIPVAKARHMPTCLSRPDPAAEASALNTAVSGYRAQPRRFEVERDGRIHRIDVPVAAPSQPEADLSHGRLEGGIGYIRIASFADMATIAAFDEALSQMRDAPGLILDVRRNGGGDTAVARPIMGRFITEQMPYALMRRREGRGLGPAWTEYVEPRGPFTFAGPVVVLTDTWSASMAEGFPMGMRSLGRGRIVGERMMGLGAAVFPLRLDRTGIELQYSGEPVYAIDGSPRWTLKPDVETTPGQDILAAGVREIQAMLGG